MVAIKSYEADRLISAPPAHFFAYLVFGSDVGLIRERSLNLFRRFSKGQHETFSTARLAGDDVASDPNLLAEEAYSIGLFGGKRAIWIETGSKQIASRFEPLFESPPSDCVIVVEAGALKRDAPLRMMFERARNAAGIECYPDSVQDLARIVDEAVSVAGLRITPDAREELLTQLGGDRAATRAEIEKLVLYAAGKDAITVHDVEAVVANESTLALDAAIGSAFSGERELVTDTAARAFETGNDPGVLIGNALRHALAMHRAKVGLEHGGSEESAINAIVRGNRNQALRERTLRQLRGWSAARLARTVDMLSDAVRRSRREPRLAETVAIRAMWSVAGAASARD